MKLFYLGPIGSYSSEAAEFWEKKSKLKIELIPKNSFHDIFLELKNDTNSLAIVPIENSITSNVHENIDQIFAQDITIAGEILLHINLHLFTLEKARISDIKTVLSHPKALQQVTEIIRTNSWEVSPTSSTSEAGKIVEEKQNKNLAAIGPRSLSQFYPALVLQQENIGDLRNNFTRFLVLTFQNKTKNNLNDNKATYIFTVPHKPGGLLKVLTPLNEAYVNITKIESRPIPEEPWCYSFWIDLEVDGIEELKNIEKIMQEETLSYRILGNYEKSMIYES